MLLLMWNQEVYHNYDLKNPLISASAGISLAEMTGMAAVAPLALMSSRRVYVY